jgi:hypothetical protein
VCGRVHVRVELGVGAGTPYHASDAVGAASMNCEWNHHTAAVNGSSAAGAAYYASIASWMAEQGVDYVKCERAAVGHWRTGRHVRL